MVKAIIPVSRLDGTSPEEFVQHLDEHHQPLMAKLPGQIE